MKPAADGARLGLRLGGGRSGEDRVRLLDAIRRHGSITRAAQEVGLSYRAAWDAVQALNNLFRQPLVRAQTGGRAGGMAALTAEGETCLETLKHLQSELAHAADLLQRRLGDGPDALGALNPWSFPMKTSARNALRGVVTQLTDGAVNAEVVLSVGPGVEIVAIITRHSVEALELAPGREVTALIKASFVILASGDPAPRTSARNQLAGVVSHLETGAVNCEVVLDLGEGKTLTAVVTRESAEALGLAVGRPATALIKASHVILAVDA